MGAPTGNNNPFSPLDGILQGGCHCRSAGCEQFEIKVIRFDHLFRGLHNAGTGVDSHNAALKFFFMVIEFRYFRNGDVVRHHPTTDGSLVNMPQINNLFLVLLDIVLVQYRQPGFHKRIHVAPSNRRIDRPDIRRRDFHIVPHFFFQQDLRQMGIGNPLRPIDIHKVGLFVRSKGRSDNTCDEYRQYEYEEVCYFF